MDAIELPERDHRTVEQLFRDDGAAASDAQRRGVVEVLVRELSKHAVGAIYDRLRDRLQGGPQT